MMDEIIRLVKLPYTVPGLVTEDEEGTPLIYLNYRLTSAQHQRTYRHEQQHIRRGDLHNDLPIHEVEQLPAPLPTAPTKGQAWQDRLKAIYARGFKLYGLMITDPLWDTIMQAWHWQYYDDRLEEILSSSSLYSREELGRMIKRIFKARAKPWHLF